MSFVLFQAADVGIEKGDLLLSVNGRSFEGLSGTDLSMEINKTISKKSGFLKIEMKRGEVVASAGHGKDSASAGVLTTTDKDKNPVEEENVTKTLKTEVSTIVSSIHEIKVELDKMKLPGAGAVYNVNINHGKQGMNCVNDTVSGNTLNLN